MNESRGTLLGVLAGVAAMVAGASVLVVACGGEPPPPAQPPPVIPALAEPTQPAPLPPDDASAPDAAAVAIGSTGPAVTVLAKSLHGSSAIALDHGAVYWIDETEGDLQRVQKRGGVTMVLYGGNGSAFAPGASLAVDETDAFWTATVLNGATKTSTLSRQDKNGGKPTVIASSPGSTLACVVTDAENVYFVQGSAIMKASKRGGAATGLAGGQTGANCVAVDDKSVYFSLGGSEKAQFADGAIVQVGKAGGAAKVLVKGADHAENLVVDDKAVYWQSGNRIMKAPKTGGEATELTKAAGPVGDIAVDDTSLYFTVPGTGTDGTVARVPKGGGAVTVLASGQAQPAGIAVDWSAAYWTCRGTEAAKFHDGTISKVDKPQ